MLGLSLIFLSFIYSLGGLAFFIGMLPLRTKINPFKLILISFLFGYFAFIAAFCHIALESETPKWMKDWLTK